MPAAVIATFILSGAATSVNSFVILFIPVLFFLLAD
jgi:hypothetical protein